MTYVRPDVRNLLDMLANQPGPEMHEVSPDEARQMMRMMGQLTERPRGELHAVEDVSIPSPHGHVIGGRVYRHAAAGAPAPVFVFYHGGGWVIGDLETHDALCAEIARTLGMTVLAVDYRLAPEHPFPAATEDCLAATRWAAGSPRELGHVVAGLVLGGDSAGGNLTAACSIDLHGQLPVSILAQFLIYPGVDMAAKGGSMEEFAEGYLLTRAGMAWFTQSYMGDAPDFGHRWASPIRSDLTGQPPALVFTCGLDPLRDQGRAYAAKLIGAGVRTVFREAAGQIHGCMNLRGAIPSAQTDLLGCLTALKAMVAEAVARLPEQRQAAE